MCDFPKEICGTNATYDNTQTTTKIVKDGKYYTQEEFRRAFPDEASAKLDWCSNIWTPTPNMSADECKNYQNLLLWAVGQPEDQTSREALENIRTNCCVPKPTESKQNTGGQKNMIIGAVVVIILIIIIFVALAKK